MKHLERPAQALPRNDRSLSSNRPAIWISEIPVSSHMPGKDGGLASTCNFTTLRESLVRDRIICGIRDSKLREDLLKVADLDLDKCVNARRASELSKERNRAIEATSEIVHYLTSGNKREEKREKRSGRQR